MRWAILIIVIAAVGMGTCTFMSMPSGWKDSIATNAPLSKLADATCADVLMAQELCEGHAPNYASRRSWTDMCANRYRALIEVKCK